MTPDSIPSLTTPGGVTPERVIRWLIYAALIVGAGLLVWLFVRLVTYLLVGVLLAYFMRPTKDWIQSFGLGQMTAISLTFLLVFGLFGMLLTYLLPFVAGEISEVSKQLSPAGVASTVAERIASWLPLDPVEIREGMVGSLETLLREDRITAMAGSVIDLFTNIFYAVAVIPFVAFFFLKDGSRLRAGFLRVIPNRYFEFSLGIVEKVEVNIGRYFRALFFQSLSIATIATVLLTLAGLDYALAVGIFAGLANTIPYFGPVIGLIAGAIIGISQTGDFALFPGVLAAMAVTQITDNLLLQPLIFSKAARAHPLVILFVVLIGAQLGGIVGMLIAIPLATTLAVVGREVFWSMRTYRGLRAA